MLELIVRAAPEIEIKKPEFGKGVREFAIRDFEAPPEKLEDGKRVRRYRYKLEAEQAGKLLIRSQQVEYVDNRAPAKEPSKRTFISATPMEIQVTTETGGQAAGLRRSGNRSPSHCRWSRSAAASAWVVGLIVVGWDWAVDLRRSSMFS